MGIKITAYSAGGTAISAIGFVPLTIGTGLVTAGSYLIDSGNWLLNKGAECKLYADGLKALNEGKMDKAKIEAKACNCSFKAALIDAYIQMMQAQQQAQPTQQPTVQPTPQPQQVTLVQDNDDVATVMAVAETLV